MGAGAAPVNRSRESQRTTHGTTQVFPRTSYLREHELAAEMSDARLLAFLVMGERCTHAAKLVPAMFTFS